MIGTILSITDDILFNPPAIVKKHVIPNTITASKGLIPNASFREFTTDSVCTQHVHGPRTKQQIASKKAPFFHPSAFFITNDLKKPSVTTAASAENARYIPGIYTSTISLGDQTFDVQVNVEQDRITAISLNNLSETTAAMYPLMEPALDSIASQIYVNQTTEGLIYGEDDRYTSELLVSAINQALEQAQNPSSAES